jgi:hypothetical protein
MTENEAQVPETGRAPENGKVVPETGDWREIDRLERVQVLGGGTDETDGEPQETQTQRRLKDWPVAWRRRPPPRDLFGLALSGGGIRSATFNLGMLQELSRSGLLDCFDYLSTVSGGGYVGGFWSAWRKRRDAGLTDPFPGSEPGVPEPPEIRHLREFSNFLRPRSSLFEVETARIVSALISGVVPCIVLAFAVLLALLGGWWILIWWFTGAGPGGLWRIPWAPALLYGAVTGLVLWGTERRLWRRSKPEGEAPSPQERGSYRPWAIGATALAALGAAVLWFAAPSPAVLLSGIPGEALPSAFGIALTPALPWLAVTLLFLGFRTAGSRCWSHDWEGRMRQAALDRTMTRLFLAAAVWTVLSAAWAVGQVLAGDGVSGLVAAFGTGGTAGGLFAWLRHRLVARSTEPAAGNLVLRLGFLLYQALAYVALVAVAAGAAALIVVVYSRFGRGGLIGLGIATLVVLGSCLLTDPHEIGLHKFYRARLVRAYLGPSNRAAWPRGTAEAKGDDLDLTDLPARPLHLICCAANDLAGDPLGSLGRGAESAVASTLGLQVGDRFRRWKGREEKAPWLSDVLTASGAAFNSHMGAISARLGKAVTFLITAIGLRLGLWLENPAEPLPDGEAGATNAGNKGKKKRAPGYLFLRELFSDSRAGARWIHLSDGAHFENLALYELVRRHCRFILLSDCAADPDRAFDDFANAVRRVREDFGVEIEIDVSPLQPDPDTGRARQPMVAGDIRYPGLKPGEEGDVGVLLYLKPTLTGNEPPDVAQYAERNERFPHETTVDQFYDEAQWESYRRLGCHAVREALRPVAGYLPHRNGAHVVGQTCGAAHVFVRARYYWPPKPDEEPSLDRLEKEWTALENGLLSGRSGGGAAAPGAVKLARQVSLRAAGGGAVSDQELVEALPAVREAIRLMEQVYLRTGFGRDDRSASNRLYMGWFNRFGVWATAPIFRAWWPWLAPFRSGDFVDFMQGMSEFGLWPTVPRGEKKILAPTAELMTPGKAQPVQTKTAAEDAEANPEADDAMTTAASDPPKSALPPVVLEQRAEPSGGYARSRFEARSRDAEAKAEPAPEERIYELELAMPATETRLNAAVLRMTVAPHPREGDAKAIARWRPEDLYVPPGLWAIGVGERFVTTLGEALPTKERVVRIEVEAPKEPSISQDALYIGAGFRRRPGGGYELDLA